jgi:hypothetical protein
MTVSRTLARHRQQRVNSLNFPQLACAVALPDSMCQLTDSTTVGLLASQTGCDVRYAVLLSGTSETALVSSTAAARQRNTKPAAIFRPTSPCARMRAVNLRSRTRTLREGVRLGESARESRTSSLSNREQWSSKYNRATNKMRSLIPHQLVHTHKKSLEERGVIGKECRSSYAISRSFKPPRGRRPSRSIETAQNRRRLFVSIAANRSFASYAGGKHRTRTTRTVNPGPRTQLSYALTTASKMWPTEHPNIEALSRRVTEASSRFR